MYAKVFTSIFDGSMRGHSDLILVFVNLLCHADQDGIVDRTVRAIADETGISSARVSKALLTLEAPDPESRSRNDDGRRLKRIDPERDWGWEVVNFVKYHTIRDCAHRREYMRNFMREKRKGKVLAPVSTPLAGVSTPLAQLAYSDSDSDSDSDLRRRGGAPPPPQPGILELCEKVKNCRPEFKGLNQMALENVFKGIPPHDAQSAVDDFCRDMIGALKLPDMPIKKLSNYLRKAFDAPGSKTQPKVRCKLS